MKTIHKLTALVLLLTLCFSCFISCEKTDDSEYRDYSFFAMDTYMTIRLARTDKNGGALTDDYLASVADGCADIISDVDLAVSAHNPNSDVYALNSDIDRMLDADELLLSLLDTADTIASLTNGAYDYTLGALTELWNVTGGGPVPSEDAIYEALSHTGTDKFSISGSVIAKNDALAKLDFGGIGKGAATQMLLEYLDTTDVSYGLVSLGGNIGVYGDKPEYGNYKIGIRDPDSADSVIGYLYLKNGFVSVSGDYERYFEENGVRYHHIIDPATGYPANSGIRSVAVHTPNGASSDALSTALFILGVEKAMALYADGTLDFEAVFVTDDGRIIPTPGLTDMFEMTSDNYTLSYQY